MHKVLIINGHPDKESLCTHLALSYKKGAEQNTDVVCDLLHLADLNFDPILRHGYRKRTELEPDLLRAQEAISAANHLVFVYPTWWATFPALLKGFIDRVFLPGFAFKYRENSVLWDKLLKGKTARLIVTMDAPVWYYRFVNKSPGHNAMKKGILEFCGVKPVKVTSFGLVKTAKTRAFQNWIKKAEQLGLKKQ